MRDFEALSRGRFPGLLGMVVDETSDGLVRAHLELRQELLAPNGFLHAATVVGLADTCCGYGTLTGLPEGGTGFTTIELKSNFLGTAREGTITCDASRTHAGRTTQVWDAIVRGPDDRTIALFRCTQLILYAR